MMKTMILLWISIKLIGFFIFFKTIWYLLTFQWQLFVLHVLFCLALVYGIYPIIDPLVLPQEWLEDDEGMHERWKK